MARDPKPPLADVPFIRHFGHWLPSKRPRPLPPHRDPGLELVYTAQGRVAWRYHDMDVPAGSRSLFFTLPWQEHGPTSDEVPPTELWWILIALDDDYDDEPGDAAFCPSLGLSPVVDRWIMQSIRQRRTPLLADLNDELASRLPVIVRELELPRTTPGRAERLRALVQALLIELARELQSADRPPLATSDSETRVREFLALLPQSCQDPWTLAAMADACELGRTQFAACLKRVTGDTPMQYLNRLRVARARELLQRSDLSVTAVAFACGFNSSQYFARVFREFDGRQPSQFRLADRDDVSDTGA